jgi:hypothetical protein
LEGAGLSPRKMLSYREGGATTTLMKGELRPSTPEVLREAFHSSLDGVGASFSSALDLISDMAGRIEALEEKVVDLTNWAKGKKVSWK